MRVAGGLSLNICCVTAIFTIFQKSRQKEKITPKESHAELRHGRPSGFRVRACVTLRPNGHFLKSHWQSTYETRPPLSPDRSSEPLRPLPPWPFSGASPEKSVRVYFGTCSALLQCFWRHGAAVVPIGCSQRCSGAPIHHSSSSYSFY